HGYRHANRLPRGPGTLPRGRPCGEGEPRAGRPDSSLVERAARSAHRSGDRPSAERFLHRPARGPRARAADCASGKARRPNESRAAQLAPPNEGCRRRGDLGESSGVDVALAPPAALPGPISPELVLVSPPEVARLARSLLSPEPPAAARAVATSEREFRPAQLTPA